MTANETWIEVARANELAVGDIVAAKLGERDVIVCRTNAGYAVLQRRCLHAGADLVHGVVSGDRVVCPLHGWCYRAATGEHVQSPMNRLASYPVRINEDGAVLACTTPRRPVKEP